MGRCSIRASGRTFARGRAGPRAVGPLLVPLGSRPPGRLPRGHRGRGVPALRRREWARSSTRCSSTRRSTSSATSWSTGPTGSRSRCAASPSSSNRDPARRVRPLQDRAHALRRRRRARHGAWPPEGPRSGRGPASGRQDERDPRAGQSAGPTRRDRGDGPPPRDLPHARGALRGRSREGDARRGRRRPRGTAPGRRAQGPARLRDRVPERWEAGAAARSRGGAAPDAGGEREPGRDADPRPVRRPSARHGHALREGHRGARSVARRRPRRSGPRARRYSNSCARPRATLRARCPASCATSGSVGAACSAMRSIG